MREGKDSMPSKISDLVQVEKSALTRALRKRACNEGLNEFEQFVFDWALIVAPEYIERAPNG